MTNQKNQYRTGSEPVAKPFVAALKLLKTLPEDKNRQMKNIIGTTKAARQDNPMRTHCPTNSGAQSAKRLPPILASVMPIVRFRPKRFDMILVREWPIMLPQVPPMYPERMVKTGSFAEISMTVARARPVAHVQIALEQPSLLITRFPKAPAVIPPSAQALKWKELIV